MSRDIDAAQFEALYRSEVRDLYAYVGRRLAGDPEDVVAETFAVAWRRRHEMPAPVFRRPWLFGVARTLVLAQHRERGEEAEAVREAAGPAPGEPVPETESVRAVREAMARLGEADREVVRLATWERLTSAEIAVALGIRPGAARVRLHRARRALANDPALVSLMCGVR